MSFTKYFSRFIILFACSYLLNQVDTFGQEKLTLQNYTTIPNNSKINHILEENNSLYVSTNKGLYQIHTKSNEVSQLIKSKSIQHLLYLNKKHYLAANLNKVINEKLEVVYQFDPNTTIYKIISYNKRIWINTTDGIFVISPKDYRLIKHYTPENSKLTSNDVKIMHKDKKNKMWIGRSPGLIIVKKKRWKIDRDFKKLNVLSITENKEGIWTLTDQDLIFTNYDGRGNAIGLGNGLKRGSVTNISSNSKGKLYIASNILVGLDPYLDQTNNLGSEIELLSKQVTTSLFDKKDQLWIGTEKSGLFLLTIEKIEQAKLRKDKETSPTEEIIPLLNTLLLVTNDIQCADSNDGSLEVQVSGGTPPYQFHWSTNSFANKISNLSAGKYSVTITDSKAQQTISVFNFAPPSPITISILDQKPVTSKSKKNGTATIDIDGGTPDYTILWDGITGSTKKRRLGKGSHKVVVTDNLGCKGELEFEIFESKILPDLAIQNLTIGQTLPIKQLYFEADSSIVRENSFEVLEEIFEFLEDNESVIIEIGGHTNNIPTHAYCNKLSTSRAKHVADYLISRGLTLDRIQYKGYGKTKPITSNKTPSGRKKNQRVELKIIEL